MSPPTPDLPENDIYQFLERTPPDWIIAHWGKLAQTPRCPLDLFHTNPRFFLSWLLIWEKTAQHLFLPWDVTQAWESLCLRAWPAAQKAWEPETITRWCRLSNLWDRVQAKLFEPPDRSKSESLEEVKRKNPDIPWDLLQREFEARKAAEKYEEDNSPIDSCDWQAPTEIVPAEVWPRAPFCTFEFPEGILKHTRKINTIVRVRRARLIQFSQELDRTAKRMEELEKFWHKMAQDIRQNLEKKLAATFPEEANLSTPAPRDAAQLIQWARGEDLTPRWAAALHPQLPEDVQAELASHWDFATRLSLAANPSVVPQILENLSRDVQPSVRAVATARLQRGTIHLTPLVGEILTPGEILWLLVAHPRSFFRFGSASYGDGSEIYAQWYKGPRGADDAWAYQGGLVYEEDERGKHPSHIGLNGLSRRGCGRYPCMYLEKEPYSGL